MTKTKALLSVFLLMSLSTSLSATQPAGNGIRLCSIGYPPESSKVATVVGAAEENTKFQLLDASTKAPVFEGTLGASMNSAATKEVARLADFSTFDKSGSYILHIDGLPDSESFEISKNALDNSLYCLMIGFYGQRCGQAVSLDWHGHTFSHAKCHMEESGLDYYDASLAGKTKDATGGWHDAGDYGKYTVNSAFTCAIMLSAWERNSANLANLKLPIPESGGPLPDYLAEIKYNLDWMLKLQMADGRVSHKVTTLNFNGMELPERDTAKTYFAPWDKLSTIDFAAVGCMVARVYEPYDAAYANTWREAARKAWLATRDVPEFRPDLSAFHTGVYLNRTDYDTMWAIIELKLTFGDEFLTEHERLQFHGATEDDNRMFDVTFDWGNGYNIGLYSYIFSEEAKAHPEALARLKIDLVGAADAIVANHDSHAYGRGIRVYYWGCNGAVARLAMNLNAAYLVTGDKKYLDTAFDQIAYLYGRNPFNRSYVTGDGINPPMNPHHRPSAGDNIVDPWPGHLVGGPNPTELDWKDELPSFSTNENAINWDASLIYALSLFYKPAAE